MYEEQELQSDAFEMNEVTHRTRAPFKVGVCMDFAGGTQIAQDFYDGMRLAIDEAIERGEVDHPVELVIREVNGPMRGTSPAVLNVWRELAHDEDCLAIVGPVVTEANLAIVEEVNRSRVPTISFCATFDWAGPYCYTLQNGGFPDEANVLASYMASRGHERVAVFHEDGLIGEEFFAAFRSAARRHGISIVGDHVVGLFNTLRPVEPQLASVRDTGADTVVVLSAYGTLAPVQRALEAVSAEWDWHPARYQNMTWVAMTALGAAGDYDKAALVETFEGWVGLDQIHEGNQHFQAVLDRFEARYGRRPFHCYTALGFDHGFVVADALSRMKPPSPGGFKDALERLRMQPACIGGPGTTISFGPHDNRGYKGEYIVLRTVENGEERLLDVSYADLLSTDPRSLGHDGDAVDGAITGEGSRYALVGDRTPFRIGVLQDWALWAKLDLWYNGLRLAFDEAFDEGLIDRPVELVISEVEGPPERDAAGVVRAWRRLVDDEQVLAVVGPFITDMVRIIRDRVERDEVPMLTYAATVKAAGDYVFQTPNGTFADETFHTARYLRRRGAHSVGVIREDNPIGDEYYDFFRQHARRLGLSVASDQIVDGHATRGDMRRAMSAIRDSGADAVMHLGYGLTFFEVLTVMQEMIERVGWDPPRATITTWVLASGLSEPGGSPFLMNQALPDGLLEGWVGVDLPHEENPVFRAFLDRYVKRFGGPRPFGCYPAHLYDIGRALAEAIGRARPVTPKGVKAGLEQVRMLPATMGGPGTVIGFAPYDHRGYKGDYLVLRGYRNGREGLAEELFADVMT